MFSYFKLLGKWLLFSLTSKKSTDLVIFFNRNFCVNEMYQLTNKKKGGGKKNAYYSMSHSKQFNKN